VATALLAARGGSVPQTPFGGMIDTRINSTQIASRPLPWFERYGIDTVPLPRQRALGAPGCRPACAAQRART
jgi:hypothetical protein